METTLIEIAGAEQAIGRIMYKTGADSRPELRTLKHAQFARRIGNLVRQIEPHLKQYAELKEAAFARYGEKTADGTQWTFKPDMIPVLQKELTDLGNEPVTLDHKAFPAEWLDAEGIELTVPDALGLGKFMDDE